MKIMVNEKNIEKVNNEFEKIQKGCRVRVCDYSDVMDAIVEIERKLNISKKDMVGTEAIVSPYAERFSGRYKGIPYGTSFTLLKTPSGWALVDVERYDINFTDEKRVQLKLSESAIEAILKKYKNFYI